MTKKTKPGEKQAGNKVLAATEVSPARCTVDKHGNNAPCGALLMALEGAIEKERTGLVRGAMAPEIIGVRYQIARGRFGVLIMKWCPWCGAQLKTQK